MQRNDNAAALSECDSSKAQDFLICVTIHKASFTVLQNADTYFVVSVDDKWSKNTVVVENTDKPFFNDYFTFDFHDFLSIVLNRTVRMSAYRRTGCTRRNVRLGEFCIDVQTVWSMENHAFHKKWVPIDNSAAETIGHVQVDMSILSKASRPRPAEIIIRDYDVIEENLLISSQQRNGKSRKMKFCVNIFSAYLLSAKECFVCIHFSGVTRVTKKVAQSQYLEWNEKLMFLGSWPSMCQTIRVEIVSAELVNWRTLGSVDLRLDDMSFSVESPFPTLGPTFIYLYHPKNTRIYLGKLLLAVSMEEHLYEFTSRHAIMSIPPLLEPEFWTLKTFHVSMQLFNVFYVNCSNGKLKFRLRWCEKTSKELIYLLDKGSNTNRSYTVSPSQIEALTIDLVLPDTRDKFKSDQLLARISRKLTDVLILIESKDAGSNATSIKSETALMDCLCDMKTLQQLVMAKPPKHFTDWDINRYSELAQFVTNATARLNNCLQTLYNGSEYIQTSIEEMSLLIITIRNYTVSHLQNRWPDLYVEFLVPDKVRSVACLDPNQYMFAPNNTSENGIFFGQRHFVSVKPLTCDHCCDHCGCLFAVAELSVCITSPTDNHAEYVRPASSTSGCRASLFLHQAKVRTECGQCSMDQGKLSVMVSMGTMSKRSSQIQSGMVPIWNEQITLTGLTVLEEDANIRPPLLFVELMDNSKPTKTIGGLCLGNALLTPTVRPKTPSEERLTNVFAEPPTVNKDEPKTNISLSSVDRNVTAPRLSLQWVCLYKDGLLTAEILISTEYFKIDGTAPNESAVLQSIPQELCPVMKQFKIDVTFVGLRNWMLVPHRTLGKYKMRISFGDLLLTSGPSSSAYGNSVNVLDPFKSGYVNLPELYEYWPSMVMLHIDCSSKKEEIIGIAVVDKPKHFYVPDLEVPSKNHVQQDTLVIVDSEDQPLLHPTKEMVPTINLFKQKCLAVKSSLVSSTNKAIHSIRTTKPAPRAKRVRTTSDQNLTWWTKFYNSFHLPTNEDAYNTDQKHSLRIYDSELELQPEFGRFRDWAEQIPLITQSKSKNVCEKSYADFKFDMKIRNSSDTLNMYSLNKAQTLMDIISEKPVTVVVYVVQGINLRPMDGLGNSDAYLRVEYGTNEINDSKSFIPNQTNPIFGKRFVVNGSLPKDNLLKISVYDHDDGLSSDDLIGSTTIDVEDRWRSRHRAFAGVAEEYCQSGYNGWRWSDTPSQILRLLCDRHGLDQPVLVGNRLQVNGQTFSDTTRLCNDEPMIERLSLAVLKQLAAIPAIGYQLVPEHVETRSLYQPERPGVEQGKLQLWIEIVESHPVTTSHSIRRPLLDITPSPPKRFELRVIVWNTSDVILDEANVFGKRMSDIYVKGWLDDADDAQSTDVHYRSLTGEGQFNWRMVFQFLYAEAEDMMVVARAKSFFEQFDTQVKCPARLQIQVWDNDALSADDFLGSTAILLSNVEPPAESAAKCRLRENNQPGRMVPINLFSLPHSIRGWFPVKGLLANGKMGQTGKVELELEVQLAGLSSAVGLGRDGPQALPPPSRPESSFNWFSNPLKSLKHIFVPELKRFLRWICVGCGVVLAVIFLVWFIFGRIARV